MQIIKNNSFCAFGHYILGALWDSIGFPLTYNV